MRIRERGTPAVAASRHRSSWTGGGVSHQREKRKAERVKRHVTTYCVVHVFLRLWASEASEEEGTLERQAKEGIDRKSYVYIICQDP